MRRWACKADGLLVLLGFDVAAFFQESPRGNAGAPAFVFLLHLLPDSPAGGAEDASDEERKAWMKWKDTKEMYMNQVDMVDGNVRKVLSFGRMR